MMTESGELGGVCNQNAPFRPLENQSVDDRYIMIKRGDSLFRYSTCSDDAGAEVHRPDLLVHFGTMSYPIAVIEHSADHDRLDTVFQQLREVEYSVRHHSDLFSGKEGDEVVLC